MKCKAHSKAVLDDWLITVDTTSLHQHKLYCCAIPLVCQIVKVNSTGYVIQSWDQDLAERSLCLVTDKTKIKGNYEEAVDTLPAYSY